VWVVGGARLIDGLHAAGLLDTIETLALPIRLGSGIPLFLESDAPPKALRLLRAEPGPLGGAWVCWDAQAESSA